MVISKQRRSHIFLGFAQNQGLQASLCQLRGFAPYLMICSGGDQWDDDDDEEEEEGGGGGMGYWKCGYDVGRGCTCTGSMDPLDLVIIEGLEFGVGQDIVVIRESRH